MSKFQNLLRSAVLAAIVIGAAFLCGLLQKKMGFPFVTTAH